MASTILAEDKHGRAIQALGLGTSQDIAFTAGASSALAVNIPADCQAVRLVADQDCRVAIGAPGVTAAATSPRLMGGVPEVFRLPAGVTSVAARGVSTGGTLNVVELI